MSKRTLEDSTEGEPSTGKRSRQELLTFKNRDGQVESTHTWSDIDSLVALRTSAQDDSNDHDSIFLASRSILCRDSMVFKDILTLPAPENPKEEDVWEGHPVIVVQDHPCDLQDFLEALHNWRSYTDSPKSKEIVHVCALLRVGTKYQVGFLRDKMIQILSNQIPTSPKDVKHMPATWEVISESLLILGTLEEIDYPLFLPMASYRVSCVLKRTFLLQTHITSPASIPKDNRTIWFASETSRLRVAMAQSTISQLHLRTLIAVLAPRSASCLSPRKCTSMLLNWRTLFQHGESPTFLLEVTISCFLPSIYDYARKGLCAPCCAHAQKELDVELAAAWDRFPLHLGMPDWDTLRANSHSTIPTTVS